MVSFALKASFVLILAAAALAQPAPPLTCVANAALVPARRVEALADIVGDYLLSCAGGTPTPPGVAVPMANVVLTLNTNITGRLLAPDWSEALLTVDEPPPAAQLVCGAPGTTVISTGVCTILGTGTGTGVYNGSVGRPNVFQARRGATNMVTWAIPLDPPSAGNRYLRITNVRGNVSTRLPSPGMAGQVTATVSVPGVVISSPTQIVAFVQSSLSTSVPAVPTLDRCTATNAALFANPAANGTVTFVVRLEELFATAWEPRTIAAFIGANTSPPPAAQDGLGSVYSSETGLYNPGFPSLAGQGNLAIAGLADQGSRLIVRFTNVPGHAKLFTQTVVNLEAAGSPTGVARLVSVAADGSGPFVPTSGNTFGIAEIPVVGGSAQAVFEILKDSPFIVEHADVPVYVAFTHSQHGIAMVAGSFAPVSAIDVSSLTASVPRFIDSGAPENAFVLPPSCH